MSNRTYVKAVYIDPNAIGEYGPELSKLTLILTKEWANAMSQIMSALLKESDEVDNLSDAQIIDEIYNASEEVLEALALGVKVGSANNTHIVNVMIDLVRKSINSPEAMLENLSQRTAGLKPSVTLRHNYPFILMPVVNSSDIEYSVHFDLNEFKTFFVVENNLGSVVDMLSSFPMDPEVRNGLSGEDFYSSINAANDESYEDDESPYEDHDEVVQPPYSSELTRVVTYSARLFDQDNNLVEERTSDESQVNALVDWASAVAILDGLQYNVVRTITTTEITVREESVI